MGLDIRVPLGALFTLLGVLLAGFGLFGDKSIYSQTLGINVNLDWGVVLLVFGIIMLLLGFRGESKGEAPSEDDGAEPRRGSH
jgi:hypothetical protein